MGFFRTSTLGLATWLLGFAIYAFALSTRNQHAYLFGAVSLSFLGYFLLCFKSGFGKKFWWLLPPVIALLCLDLPKLSDDFYRFYWDGFQVAKGLSPFALTPKDLLGLSILPPELNEVYPLLNSPNYYSIYTPFNQFVFALPFWLGIKSLWCFVLVQRVLFAGVFILSLLSTQSLLSSKNLAPKLAAYFYLNPLVLIEGIGNLHVEIIIVALVPIALFVYGRVNQWAGKFIVFLSVGLKLSTLPILLPFLFYFKGRKLFGLLLLGGLAFAVTAVGVGSTNYLENLLSSLRLFSETFEFNGGVYYLVNSAFSSYLGYNAIAIVGKGLNILALAAIAWLSVNLLLRRDFSVNQLVLHAQQVALIFLLCSTTIHPWYLIIPIAGCVLVLHPFLLTWSATVFLSYMFYPSLQIGYWLGLEYLIPAVVAIIYRLQTGSWVKFHNSRF